MRSSGKWIALTYKSKRVATLVLTFILIISSFELDAQWVIKNLDEESYSYETCLSFKNDSVGLMMGTNSIAYKSRDVAETWDDINLNIQINIKDFQFVGDSEVYAIGDHYMGAGSDLKSKLIKSVDDGDTWDSITSFSGLSLQALYFINSDTGLVAGFDAILRTEDGGYSWDTVWSITKFGYKYGGLVDIALPTNEVGYAIGVGRTQSGENTFDHFILKSVDTGLSWDTITSFNQTLRTLYFINPEIGFIGTETGSVYRTFDGGLTWIESKVVEDLPILSIQFISEQIGYATGGREIWITKSGTSGSQSGETGFHISKSLDGGDTWETFDTTGIPLQSIHFINDTIGFVSGLHSLIMKSEGEIKGLPENYPWHLVQSGYIEEADLEPGQIYVYPNPTTGEIFIRLNKITKHPAKIELYGITGQKIFEDHINPGIQKIMLDINNQEGSMFILKIDTEFGSYTRRIIKID